MIENELLAAALKYAELGWRVFPAWEIGPSGVCTCEEGADCTRPGKHPRISAWTTEATTDRMQIEKWWGRWPRANLALATGEKSDLTVIDADTSKGKPGVINLTKLCGAHGGIPPEAMQARSGSGGLHLYFRYAAELRNGTNVLGEAIDVRSEGGYVIAPPSNHASGGRYSMLNGVARPSVLPQWLLAPQKSEPKTPQHKRRERHTQHSLVQVEAMLLHVSPDDRDKWLKVGIILGKGFVGTESESEAWALYEEWSARSEKFDENRAENLSRMREMFSEMSQAEPRSGQTEIGCGATIRVRRARQTR